MWCDKVVGKELRGEYVRNEKVERNNESDIRSYIYKYL